MLRVGTARSSCVDRISRDEAHYRGSMTATKRPGVATHYVRYLGGNLLVMLASFVSFPLMARLLDNHEFGVLGYYETWLLVAVGVLKLGTQHAILRFYPHGGDEHALA